jgi:hypothetical protein
MQEDTTPCQNVCPAALHAQLPRRCLALARCGCLPEPSQCCALLAQAYAACEQMSALTRSSGG